MRFVSTLLTVCFLTSLLGWAKPSFSQEKSGATVIAVVDMKRILRESKATRTIRPQIEKLNAVYKAEYKRETKQLRAANRELSRQRTILSPEAFAQRRKAFEQKAKNIRRIVARKKRTIEQALARAMGEVHKILRKVTIKIAKERSLDMIIPRSSVFMVQNKHDFTNEVLKELNSQLPTVTVTTTAPKKKK